MDGLCVLPGDVLGVPQGCAAGGGVYGDTTLRASRVGRLRVRQRPEDGRSVASVSPIARGAAGAARAILREGDVVACEVVRLTPNCAYVDVFQCGAVALAERAPAQIRREDVRAAFVDAPGLIESSFRLSDVVRCRVASLGGARSYFLSTAEPQLGVVWARSAATGEVLTPVSDSEMEDPSTGKTESRKTAAL